MQLAILVYLFVLTIAVSCAYCFSHKNYSRISLCNIYIIFPVIIISLLAGFRYKVGTDWENYYEYYQRILNYGMSMDAIKDSTIEPLYLILNCIIAFFKFPYQLFFGVVMFIHLFFLYKSFKDYTWLLPLGLFFYFSSIFTTSLNIQRQTLAFCIFLYATIFYRNGDGLKYLLTVILASCFHYSSLILLPIYFLRFKCFSFLENRWLGLFLYIFSFFLFSYVLEFIYILLTNFVTNVKYLNNMSALGNLEMGVNSGIGIFIFHFFDIVIIWNSKMLSKSFKDINFCFLYRAFFIGVILSNIFGNDIFLSRVPFALESLRFIMLAFLVYKMLQHRTILNYLLALFIIILNFSTFIMAILHGHSGCSPYYFA